MPMAMALPWPGLSIANAMKMPSTGGNIWRSCFSNTLELNYISLFQINVKCQKTGIHGPGGVLTTGSVVWLGCSPHDQEVLGS